MNKITIMIASVIFFSAGCSYQIPIAKIEKGQSVIEQGRRCEINFKSTANAYVIQDNEAEAILIEKNGEKNIIDKIEKSDNVEKRYEDLIFGNLQFSPKGNYLMYDVIGMGGFIVKIWDVQNKKIIYECEMPSLYGFTKDERYFYECAVSGYVGGHVQITSLPALKKENLSSSKLVTNCISYDGKTDILRYALGDNLDEEEVYEYLFD